MVREEAAGGCAALAMCVNVTGNTRAEAAGAALLVA